MGFNLGFKGLKPVADDE